ncbi:hypothetical protein G3A43_42185 [Paraburkholderia aspalathi]|uniref:hypothetical protein n=1 Tax=Paraburkholderia nemoris TaxID=2793076 RepID=UPI00190C3476|nr:MULTISPECIES: hypothetical protein [Paraburkholderia]MBK3786791.1 hypothetical protein [Paraburkholderia aspalathi]
MALRHAEAIRARLTRQLRELHALDARGRALLRDASGISSGDLLMAIGGALQAEKG